MNRPLNELNKICALMRIKDYHESHKLLINVIQSNRGNVLKSANTLKIHHSTIKRWITRLEKEGFNIREHIDQIRCERRHDHEIKETEQ